MGIMQPQEGETTINLPGTDIPTDHEGTEELGPPEEYKPVFTGRAGEYFRIWIVNTLLTVITFGIYMAWAKVRTRRYFYAHTELAHSPFDFTGDPVAILKGNAVVGLGFILYTLANKFSPPYGWLLLGLFYLVLPYMVFKSLRFNARNSTYRGISFRFYGTLWESYKTYLFYPLLIPVTLGLIYPYWMLGRKAYFLNSFTFGAARNSFTGRAGPFYKTYAASAVAILGLFVISGALYAVVIVLFRPPAVMNPMLLGLLVGGSFALFFSAFRQYVNARLTNYCWGQVEMAGVRFRSTLNPGTLAWIQLTNILAIIVSVGLLAPWAKVRRARYVLDNLVITTPAGLDHFTSVHEPDESAVGDAATDFYDFDIGL